MKEQERAEGLTSTLRLRSPLPSVGDFAGHASLSAGVLGGGGDFLIDRQMPEKGLDFGRSHLSRMTLVKLNRAPDPFDAGGFRAESVMLEVERFANLFKQMTGAL